MIRADRILMAISKIGAGSLPDTLEVRTFGGSSNGAICNAVIVPGATELELDGRAMA
jgi:hypothetical protein